MKKSPRPISNRFSAFRFSLYSLRSPVSPLSPQTPKIPGPIGEALPTCYSTTSSSSSSSTTRSSPNPDKDTTNVGIKVVDSEDLNALRSPVVLPIPGPSPITPWHATFHRHAATIEQETDYLKRNAQLRYVRLAISVLVLATAATLTGLQADILAHYYRTHLPTEWFLILWPTDTNLVPSFLTVITGGVATLLALSTIAVAAIRSPNPRTKLNNGIFTLLCGITAPLSLATLVVASVISPATIFSSFVSNTLSSLGTVSGPSHTIGLSPNPQGIGAKRETIQSFTCSIANSAKAFHSNASVLKLPAGVDNGTLAPDGFDKICTESKASLVATIVLLVFASVGLAVATWTWSIERQIEQLRGEREVVASRHGSRQGSQDAKIDGAGIPESLVGIHQEKQMSV